jgi:hypothetical protein
LHDIAVRKQYTSSRWSEPTSQSFAGNTLKDHDKTQAGYPLNQQISNGVFPEQKARELRPSKDCSSIYLIYANGVKTASRWVSEHQNDSKWLSEYSFQNFAIKICIGKYTKL